VIKGEDDEMVWDIFCKSHASAVSEPLKPKAKAKMVTQLAAAPIQEYVEEKYRGSSKRGERKERPLLSMAHSVKKTSSPRPTETKASNVQKKGKDKGNKKLSSKDSDDDSEEEDEEEEQEQEQLDVAASSNVAPLKTFPILTLNEWPGQAEGEAMDLDHFWNVAAMQYPEDHSAEWLDFMTAPLLGSEMLGLGSSEPLQALPPLGDGSQILELADSLEEKLIAMGTERGRGSLLDLEKREQYIKTVFLR
jgi:hypothetical protein